MLSLNAQLLEQIASGAHPNPHSFLGQHTTVDPSSGMTTTTVRVRRPLATSVAVRLGNGTEVELERAGAGIWQGSYASAPHDYHVVARFADAPDWVARDPYAFAPTIRVHELEALTAGTHERLWQVLGAHVLTVPGIDADSRGTSGTAFSVWAPRARAVRVAGDFNGWDGTRGAMRLLGDSGVWEIFVPGAAAGEAYKFEILTTSDRWVYKSDPMARRAEEAPDTASIIAAPSEYLWADDAWMARRVSVPAAGAPMTIYQVHLGSWRPGLSYGDAAASLVDYVVAQGFTHVEFLPLAQHPAATSLGFHVTSYYAPTARFGTPDDMRLLIDRLHQADIGVIMDWVPAQFPKDLFALAKFDGLPLYEHPEPRRHEAELATVPFDYRRPEVRSFLVSNARYWLEEFHLDGLRLDAVASMLYLDDARADDAWAPNVHGGRKNFDAIKFLQQLSTAVHTALPGALLIAENASGFPGTTESPTRAGLGFDMKWDTRWMRDSLRFMTRQHAERARHVGEMRYSFTAAAHERVVLPLSHETVVDGRQSLLTRMPGDAAQKLANIRAYLSFMWAHPGKKLLFMGTELGQTSAWSEQHGLDWWLLEQPGHAQLHHFMSVLNRTYRARSELWSRDSDPAAFARVGGPGNHPDVIAFTRRDFSGGTLAIVANFSPTLVHDIALDLPHSGVWHEIFNSDAAEFGGTGVSNLGMVHAGYQSEQVPARAAMVLPPLGVLWLAHGREPHVPSPTQG